MANKKANKSKDSKKAKVSRFSLSPLQQTVMNYCAMAVLFLGVVFYFVWRSFVEPYHQAAFDQAASELAKARSNKVAEYVQQMQSQLSNVSQDPVFASTADDLANFREGLGNAINIPIDGLVSAQFFRSGQAQQEKDQGGAISFVELDMLNRVEQGNTVYPEAARLPGNDDWIIYWVAPVVDSNKKVLGSLSIVTTTDGLRQSIEGDSSLAQIQLVQVIGSRQLIILSQGLGSTSLKEIEPIAQSHWQISLTASSKLKAQTFTMPIWVLALYAVLLLAVLFVTWKTIRLKLQREAATQQLYQDAKAVFEAVKHPDVIVNTDDEFLEESDSQNSNQEDPLLIEDAPTDAAGSNQIAGAPLHVFRAYDIRGLAGEELTPAFAKTLGQAFANEAKAQGETAIYVGHDARISSPDLFEGICAGVLSMGLNVVDLGLVPTPLVHFAAALEGHCKSGIMVTASHNPKAYNGFKMSINQRTLKADDIQKLKDSMFARNWQVSAENGERTVFSIHEDYIDTITADVAISSGVRVVVDAANGAMSDIAPVLLEELGCDVIPLFCQFDGDFPNHEPDPSQEKNLQSLIEHVMSNDAELGIALDGDGDRLVAVTATGKIVWPDQLLMIFAKDVVSRNPGCDVVFDIKSTRHLNSVISEYGGRPVMWKTGHSNMKAKVDETGALISGEFSGHIFFNERWFGFDDGLYAAVRLLEILSLQGQTLDEIVDELPTSLVTPEIKVPVAEERKLALIDELINSGDFANGNKILIDGLRIEFEKGWGLVRASNTSAAITLRFEADDEPALTELKRLFKREITKLDNTLELNF